MRGFFPGTWHLGTIRCDRRGLRWARRPSLDEDPAFLPSARRRAALALSSSPRAFRVAMTEAISLCAVNVSWASRFGAGHVVQAGGQCQARSWPVAGTSHLGGLGLRASGWGGSSPERRGPVVGPALGAGHAPGTCLAPADPAFPNMYTVSILLFASAPRLRLAPKVIECFLIILRKGMRLQQALPFIFGRPR